MPTEFLIGRFPQGLIFRIVGRGTMQESVAFRTAVEQCPEDAIVVFDAMHCDYVDSTFLGCLVWTKKTCNASQPRRFVIAACDATKTKLFAASSLHHYFDFVDACPELDEDFEAIDVAKVDAQELGRHVMRCHHLLADLGGHKSGAFRAVAERLAEELGEKTSNPVGE